MVKLSLSEAKRNSNILLQKAIERREKFCVSNELFVQAGQISQRNISTNLPNTKEEIKIKIDKPKICKL